ncbi:MAG: glycosyl hydrolase [Chloroflexi bacterium]|nr:MAG: glycosyl hydrolase [Chloroflexota bacterium]
MFQQGYFWLKTLVLVVAALALVACGAPTPTQGTTRSDSQAAGSHSHAENSSEGATHSHGEEFELPHIHGLGFTADGKSLLIPAHIGIFTVSDGTWQHPSGPSHDYMGFSISDDGFYSSGHPAPSVTDLKNPLGLVKSTDGGKTLQKLGFEGETDFHLMSVGYTNHALYVLNPAQNSKLAPGMHYSLDDGATWTQSALQGVDTAPFAIAVHPTEANIVALATERGVLLSSDYGATFASIGDAMPATALSFSPNGTLLFGATELFSYDATTKQIASLPTPALVDEEFVTAIAANPKQPQEVALATNKLNVYQTKNNGQEWATLAGDGVGVNVKDEH